MLEPEEEYSATAKICDFGYVNDIHQTSSLFQTTNHLLKTCGDKVWWAMFVNDWMKRRPKSTVYKHLDDMNGLALIFITLRNVLTGETVEESGMEDGDLIIYNAITKDRCSADELMRLLPIDDD